MQRQTGIGLYPLLHTHKRCTHGMLLNHKFLKSKIIKKDII